MEVSNLPYEMFMEIMSRASSKTFATIRCTCNYLNTLANESFVLDMNTKRNNIVSGFIIQNLRRGCWYTKEFAPSPESKSLDLRFLQDDTRILATSEQGIMVFMKPDPMNCRKYAYYVCKPATKQISTLPRPKGNHTVEMMAIVVMGSEPLHYKIIRFAQSSCLKQWGNFNTTYRCDIFDSLTWEWRSLEHVKLVDHRVHFLNSQPITVSGSIYMLLSNNDVFKFDAYTEKWKVFSSPIPYDESGFSSPMELVKCGVRLGLACKPISANGVWEIWVYMLDERWEKQDVAAEAKSKFEWLKALHGSDTSVMVDCDTLVFYKFKEHGNNMTSKVVLNDIPYQIFFFLSDFEPLDLCSMSNRLIGFWVLLLLGLAFRCLPLWFRLS